MTAGRHLYDSDALLSARVSGIGTGAPGGGINDLFLMIVAGVISYGLIPMDYPIACAMAAGG
jgi:hypothetical protein